MNKSEMMVAKQIEVCGKRTVVMFGFAPKLMIIVHF